MRDCLKPQVTPRFNLSFWLIPHCPVTYGAALEAQGECSILHQDPSDTKPRSSELP